jgi:hypothetical protein
MTLTRLAIVAVLCCATSVARAQVRDSTATRIRAFVPKVGEPGVLVGVVLDTASNGVDGAEIMISSLKRRVMATADGTFRFDQLKPGTYEVSARRLGFAPQVRSAVVTDSGGGMAFELLPIPHALPPVITATKRGGLSGVIGDTAFGIVPGAQVTVLGTAHHALSDSAGLFHFDVHPGKYMVRVTRQGFASRMMSVTVPPDSGRRIAVWLMPSDKGESIGERIAAFGLNQMLIRRTPMTSTLYTHEDIQRLGFTDASEIARMGSVKPVPDDCTVGIDGIPGKWVFIWELAAADIELMEIALTSPVSTDRKPRANAASKKSGASGSGKAAETRSAYDRFMGRGGDCPSMTAYLRK